MLGNHQVGNFMSANANPDLLQQVTKLTEKLNMNISVIGYNALNRLQL